MEAALVIVGAQCRDDGPHEMYRIAQCSTRTGQRLGVVTSV